MSLKNYKIVEDYFEFFGKNTDGRGLHGFSGRVHKIAPSMPQRIICFLADKIHASDLFFHLDPEARQKTEWFVAESIANSEYHHDFDNAIIKWLLAPACFEMAKINPLMPSTERILQRNTSGKLVILGNLFLYLKEVAENDALLSGLMRFATNPEKVTDNDVIGCMEEELKRIFERRREQNNLG